MNRETLMKAGIDYDEGTARFGGRPELYEKYLKKFFEGQLMETIAQQLENKDIAGAFRTTHDLKGVAGNLSLNRFHAAVCDLTERLRAGVYDGEGEKTFALMKTWYEKAKHAVEGEAQ